MKKNGCNLYNKRAFNYCSMLNIFRDGKTFYLELHPDIVGFPIDKSIQIMPKRAILFSLNKTRPQFFFEI